MGIDATSNMNSKSKGATLFRKWSRLIHRDVSYFFAGILIIYCISGIYMNHRNEMNVHYTVERTEFETNKYKSGSKLSEAEVRDLLSN